MPHASAPLAGTARTRRLLAASLALAAFASMTGTAAAGDDVAANHLGQVQSNGQAYSSPAGDPPDSAGPPAGAGTGRKLR
jgi:hypothetical protein